MRPARLTTGNPKKAMLYRASFGPSISTGVFQVAPPSSLRAQTTEELSAAS